jgi:transcriptional regulator with XRE-family HTH domain
MPPIVAAAVNPVPERLYPGIRTTWLSRQPLRDTDFVATVLNGNGSSATRRHELATFLRSRRERVKPEQVGLPPSRRRRTPGLRREEVAQLAGVGVTWYTWLEQGREINASPQVLDAIARTLQFDAHEHSHLLTLAGLPARAIEPDCEETCPTARLLIDQLEPYPACVLNARFDLLAYNRPYASFFDDLESIPLEDRNCLWLAFTNPRWRAVIVHWEEAVARMVAEYRAAMAEHIDDPAWQAFVDRLHRASPEFTAIWNRHDVLGVQSRTKEAFHPLVGFLRLDYTNLWLDQGLGIRIVSFTPTDELTSERLEELDRMLEGRASTTT